MKILIVEDNELDLKLFRKVLHHRGFKTIGARNGAEGIVIAAEEQPALILMDMHMPGIDGMEAKNILRKDPLTKNIPLIATSYDRMEAPHKIGFDKCITKPVDLTDVPPSKNRFSLKTASYRIFSLNVATKIYNIYHFYLDKA